MSTLRNASKKWAPKNNAKKKARRGKIVNPETGRENWANECAMCHELVLEKESEVDHAEPVVPIEGFKGSSSTFLDYDWNVILERLLIEEHGFQVLCKPCHLIKTNNSRERRKK